jgi:VWFA-related protein
MKTAALFLALLVPASAVLAQTPYIETFEVRLHNLDVVVTDAKGKPVHGLTKNDFVVVENGAAQSITNFSVYDLGVRVPQPPPSSDPAAPEHTKAVAAATALQAEAPPPRRFVFFIDDLALRRNVREQLYKSARSFVDSMREGDVAAVVRPTTQNKIVQEYTGDRAAIERALKDAIDQSDEKFTGPRAEIANLRWKLRNAGTPQLRRAAKREYSDAAARRVEHRLGQVRALTTSLAGVEGKKIVVLVTMGLSAKPGNEAWDFGEQLGMGDPGANVVADEMEMADDREGRYRPIVHDLTARINDIGRSAAASGVTIYALEPDVPLDLLVRGAASIPAVPTKGGESGPDPNIELPTGFHTDILQNSEATLSSLAEKTGGRWYRGTASIDDTFRQVSDDLSFYYSLAYHATGDVDKARRVTVSIRNRPELHVRTRSEVFEKSTSREMTDLVVASLLYPRPVNELGINVTAGTPQKDRGLFTIPLDVVMPLKNLTFLPADDGKYAASFDLHYAAAGEERDFGTGGKRQQRIEISPEQYAHLGEITYRYKTGIQVSPGRARIAIGVIDTATKLTGFRTVEVIAQ